MYFMHLYYARRQYSFASMSTRNCIWMRRTKKFLLELAEGVYRNGMLETSNLTVYCLLDGRMTGTYILLSAVFSYYRCVSRKSIYDIVT